MRNTNVYCNVLSKCKTKLLIFSCQEQKDVHSATSEAYFS